MIRRRSTFVTLCCLALTLYFAHHALYGRYGLEARRSYSARVSALAERVARLEATRAHLSRDIALLGADPHPDIIEELARRNLGFAYTDARLLAVRR